MLQITTFLYRCILRCSATAEVREGGGGGGGGTGLQGSLEREGGPRKRGLRR